MIDEHCTSEWAEQMATGWADWEDEGRTKMIADPAPHDLRAHGRGRAGLARCGRSPCSMPGRRTSPPRAAIADAIHAALIEALEANGALYQ